MSNFSALTFHPVTNIIEMANWMDDYFGKHHYGVYFSSDGVTYDPFKDDCERVYPKAADRIEQLAQKVKDLTAERDDAWRICATWRERAHAAEAKEIPSAEGEGE